MAALRLLLYLGLAVLLTWPMALDPVGSVVGHPAASVSCHVWVLWWAGQGLGDWHSPLVFAPQGADVFQLYGSDLLSPVIAALLPDLPASLLYNLWVVGLLLAGGLGTDRLCRDLGAASSGAVVGGTVFLTAPFFQHELFNGTSELMAAAVLPWFAAAVTGLLRRPSVATGLAVGLTIGLGVAASAYNLFFLVVLGVCLVLARAVGSIEPVFTGPVMRAVAVAGGVAALAGLPLAWLHHAHGGAELMARRGNWAEPELFLPDSFADLLAWVDPRAAVMPVMLPLPGGEPFAYWTTSTVYLGFAAMSLALVGAWSARRHRLPLGGMLAAGVVAWLLALGPFLRIGGQLVKVAGHRVELPALVLASLVPPFSVTALHAYRYAGLVVLVLAVLASLAVRRGPVLALAAVGSVLLDAVVLSPVPWPAATTRMPHSVVLSDLAARTPGAVLTLPSARDDLGALGRLLLAQTVHGHPVHDGGIHDRAGREAVALFDEVPALRDLTARSGPRLPGPVESAWAFERLHDAGYRYLLVAADAAEVEAWAVGSLGEPVASDPDWRLWTL